ncbi:Protein of unknown function DUF262 [Salegentibacter echinorum]|uniref:Uncharacterized protein n=1 Tax=Salegentibacter echinorum TaxID=1073325 RepID=A0A1M5LUJ7_SALEC|nr:DUF262 domain-containing protein [Salegentibacter echinorum]SHG68309.1 Protein of unknown function DUF262 [Salegentibacter echinorum]
MEENFSSSPETIEKDSPMEIKENHDERLEEKIKVTSCSIADLFQLQNVALPGTNISGKLSIPEYQRPYVWRKRQLSKLVDDFSKFFNSYELGDPHYYLGSIIIHQTDENLNIIDGQQRITSLLLLAEIQNFLSKPKVTYSSPQSIFRIKENIEFLKSKKLPAINWRLLNVTLVITDNEDDAYTFFETQNTGGVRLSGADIIKSHHLRAIKDKKLLNNKAQNWESNSNDNTKYVIELLCKARCWNIVFWENFPFYKHKRAIKNKVVEKFTENTEKESRNISFIQAEIEKTNFQENIRLTSHLKSLRQPLYDGENYIDFLTEYVETYEVLFLKNEDYRIDPRFYDFRNKLISGKDGTIFLKELFEILLLCYVSKFGYKDIYEFSLWTFRYVYSLRVIKKRTVREDTMTSFVKETFILDKVFSTYSHREVINILKKYSYKFNDENCGDNNVKGRYIRGLGKYFTINFSNGIVTKDFDSKLKKDIYGKM